MHQLIPRNVSVTPQQQKLACRDCWTQDCPQPWAFQNTHESLIHECRTKEKCSNGPTVSISAKSEARDWCPDFESETKTRVIVIIFNFEILQEAQ